MMRPKSLVSIVGPCFQEEEVLPLFHRELATVLDTLADEYDFEVLYVDDGSRDDTLDVIKCLARDDARVQYLSLSRNFGHQAALTAGLEHARGEAVISMDTDLQHPPTVLPTLLQHWRAGYEVVITIREDDQRLGHFKRFTSRAFYAVMRWISATEVRLAASDFRLLSRNALIALMQLRERHRFLRGMVQWLGFPAAEVVFKPDARRAGQSKYTLRRMLRLAADGLFSFSALPLRLPLYLGSIVLLGGIGHAAWLAARLAGHTTPPTELDYLVAGMGVLGGGILCAIGCLGEYVGRIYEQVKQRPLYLLKEASALPAVGRLETLPRKVA
jgi:polyisoprenyl-phosphate glycosyltransferase